MSDHTAIGPALPPMFQQTTDYDSDEEAPIGPALPPVYRADDSSSSSDDADSFRRGKGNTSKCEAAEPSSSKKPKVCTDDDGFFGPALPPDYTKQQVSPERPPVLGPALPPGFRRTSDDEEDDDDGGDVGPALPPGYTAESSGSESDGDGEDVVGPMPFTGDRSSHNSVAEDFERRARKMKDKLTGADQGPEEVKRETWMTELPPELQHIGLGARTFKKKAGPEKGGDRSMWTDTPADRERKERERLEGKSEDSKKKKKEEEAPRMSKKDIDMAQKVSKYNESKRGESLYNMHSKKLKRKAEAEADKPVERRAFDRDQDLQANRFDDAQKKQLLRKSAELNTRFSHSKDRMFL